MGVGFQNPDTARMAAIHRSIPTSRATITVNTSQSIDLSNVTVTDGVGAGQSRDLSGLYVYLCAGVADVTVQRGNAPDSAGKGLVLTAGAPPEDFYVAKGGNTVLHGVSAASAELHVLWDDDQL
jgi:hypothetical protein